MITALTLAVLAQTAPITFDFHDAHDLPTQAAVMSDAKIAREVIEKFFGEPFLAPVKIDVMPSRREMDAVFAKRWKAPKTERWMVAAGVADTVILLSPAAWKADADEHDATNSGHVQRIITHELVHSYHGQHNKDNQLAAMDTVGWFVEGLATFVSGQMAEEHKGKAQEAVAAGKAPTKLETAWSGRYRYAVCGSMVAYIDKAYGRKKVFELLSKQSNSDILSVLGKTEDGFLSDWRKSIQ